MKRNSMNMYTIYLRKCACHTQSQWCDSLADILMSLAPCRGYHLHRQCWVAREVDWASPLVTCVCTTASSSFRGKSESISEPANTTGTGLGCPQKERPEWLCSCARHRRKQPWSGSSHMDDCEAKRTTTTAKTTAKTTTKTTALLHLRRCLCGADAAGQLGSGVSYISVFLSPRSTATQFLQRS